MGYRDTLRQQQYYDDVFAQQRHQKKQGLWGTLLGGLAMIFLPTLLIGTAGMGTAVAGTAGTTGLFGKLGLPVAKLALKPWFKPLIQGLATGAGTLIGTKLAGKAPDTLFGGGGGDGAGAMALAAGGTALFDAYQSGIQESEWKADLLASQGGGDPSVERWQIPESNIPELNMEEIKESLFGAEARWQRLSNITDPWSNIGELPTYNTEE
jgi:hypothetical protein